MYYVTFFRNNEFKFLFLTSSPSSDLLMFGTQVIQISLCCFNLQSPMTYYVGQFYSFLAFCISSLVIICSGFLFIFKTGLFIYLWVLTVLCVYWIAILYQMYNLYIFFFFKLVVYILAPWLWFYLITFFQLIVLNSSSCLHFLCVYLPPLLFCVLCFHYLFGTFTYFYFIFYLF